MRPMSAGTVDGGSAVTITGTGFDGATVTFDGTASGRRPSIRPAPRSSAQPRLMPPGR